MCCKAEEHTKYTVVRCTIFAPSVYTNRRSKAAGYIHWTICEHVGLQVTGRDCEHVSERVITVNVTAIMLDVPGITDQKTFANRTDTVLHDKWKKACLLIDIAIPDDSKVSTEEFKKIKYKELDIAVCRMWKVRTKITSVIIGASETVKKGLDQNLQLLPGHRSATDLQKVALMSTAHSIRYVLGGNRFDLLLRSGFTGKPPPDS